MQAGLTPNKNFQSKRESQNNQSLSHEKKPMSPFGIPKISTVTGVHEQLAEFDNPAQKTPIPVIGSVMVSKRGIRKPNYQLSQRQISGNEFEDGIDVRS